MTWIDDVAGFLVDAPASFIIGALFGFWLSNRYRVVKRKDSDDRAA